MSFSPTSSISDLPVSRFLIMFSFTSYPITLNFFAKAIASGNPTYPTPIIPILALLLSSFMTRLPVISFIPYHL